MLQTIHWSSVIIAVSCIIIIIQTNNFTITKYPTIIESSELSYLTEIDMKYKLVLGNQIKTLVIEEKPTGTYELIWNASELPSGVYFYRLQAGDFIQTKKMVLMK